MILLTARINKDVTKKHDNKHFNTWIYNYFLKADECCRWICQAKRKNKKLVVVITGPECHLQDLTFSYSRMMLAVSEVYLRQKSGTLKFIKKIFNS